MLATFDAQVRRSAQPDGPGERAEVDGPVVRQVAADAPGWSGITWLQLTMTMLTLSSPGRWRTSVISAGSSSGKLYD